MGAKSLKIMHVSDVRLGGIFPMMSAEKSASLRERHLTALCDAVDKEVKSGVRIVLISGNLLASPFPEHSVTDALLKLWCAHPEVSFVISPGALDCNSPVYALRGLPGNVHVFTSSTVKRLTLKEFGVAIYGWQVKRGAKNTVPLRDKSVDKTPLLKLVLGSATQEDECPYTVSEEDIESFGADYCALGGLTQYRAAKNAGSTLYAYTGAFLSQNAEEHGYGGYILLTANETDGAWTVAARRREIRLHRYERMNVSLKGATNLQSLCSELTGEVGAKKFGKESSVRITVSGNLPATLMLPEKIAELDEMLCSYEIIDETMPLLDREEMERDPTALGALFRNMKPKMMQSSKQKRLAAARVFRTALSALTATRKRPSR